MIEGEAAAFDRILLATGFCGDSFCGLETRHTELIIPRTDDCISLLLGSAETGESSPSTAGRIF